MDKVFSEFMAYMLVGCIVYCLISCGHYLYKCAIKENELAKYINSRKEVK